MLRTYDDAGRVQLDPELFTYVSTGTGTITTVAETGSGTNASDAQLVLSGNVSPLIALAGGSGYKLAMLRRYFNGTNTIYYFISDAPVGTTFSYYLFKKADQLSASGSLMTLYDASGAVTFASNHPWMICNQIVTYSSKHTAAGSAPAPTAVAATGRTLAVVPLAAGGYNTRSGFASALNGQGPNQPGNWAVPVMVAQYGCGAGGDTASIGFVEWQAVDVTVYAATRAAAHAAVDAGSYTIPASFFVIDVTHI